MRLLIRLWADVAFFSRVNWKKTVWDNAGDKSKPQLVFLQTLVLPAAQWTSEVGKSRQTFNGPTAGHEEVNRVESKQTFNGPTVDQAEVDHVKRGSRDVIMSRAVLHNPLSWRGQKSEIKPSQQLVVGRCSHVWSAGCAIKWPAVEYETRSTEKCWTAALIATAVNQFQTFRLVRTDVARHWHIRIYGNVAKPATTYPHGQLQFYFYPTSNWRVKKSQILTWIGMPNQYFLW